MVSNLTISTSTSEVTAVRRRAISSVCASAVTLLRVPLRIATTHAPFGAAQNQQLISGRKISSRAFSKPEFSFPKSNLMVRVISGLTLCGDCI